MSHAHLGRPQPSLDHPSVPRPLRCLIKNLETGATLTACFNPKDLQVSKQVPWSEHAGKTDLPALEYTKGSPMELSLELLFDTYESREDVYQAYIAPLQSVTQVVDEATRRPPMCLFLWGVFPSFMGVITSLQVKYTMFLANGRPVRATCQVTLKQAERLSWKAETGTRREGEAAPFCERGRLATEDELRRADKFHPDHRRVLDAHGSEDGRLRPGAPVPLGAPRRG